MPVKDDDDEPMPVDDEEHSADATTEVLAGASEHDHEPEAAPTATGYSYDPSNDATTDVYYETGGDASEYQWTDEQLNAYNADPYAFYTQYYGAEAADEWAAANYGQTEEYYDEEQYAEAEAEEAPTGADVDLDKPYGHLVKTKKKTTEQRLKSE